jgi:arginyl-tRNA synthetase
LQLLGKDVGYTDDAHLPDWLYRGDYVTDIARRIIEKIGDRYAQTLLGDPDLINVFRLLAQEGMQAQQDGDLTAFGIKFDRWFNESTLHESGEVKAAIDDLTKKGLTYESDGAIWLKSTLFNDDKDRVLMRANGTATYIAGDLAYHRDKFKRGYDLVIDVWGADHGGYVARTKAAVEASGVDPARLEILLFQLVRISKNGELVLSSKRRGNVLELKADLIDEIGIDAARFFFLMRSADGPLDIDLELAREQSNKNPVFYVQYAHARACTVFAKATADYGITVMADPEAKLELLTLETEKDLIRKIGDWPDELEYAASHRAPHLITQYLRDLAALFHTNYDAGNNDPSARMLCDDKELRSARLYLTFAVRTVIANALNVLGLSAPETM